jgi:hypothetical protein
MPRRVLPARLSVVKMATTYGGTPLTQDRFDALVQGAAARLDSPAGVARASVGRHRRGVLAALLAGTLGVVGSDRSQAKAKKKKKAHAARPCPVCPPPPPSPVCPDFCGFHYHQPDSGIICGRGHSVQSPCTPCTATRDCTDAAFPHCLREFNFVSSGQRQSAAPQCGTFANGVCGAVFACSR